MRCSFAMSGNGARCSSQRVLSSLAAEASMRSGQRVAGAIKICPRTLELPRAGFSQISNFRAPVPMYTVARNRGCCWKALKLRHAHGMRRKTFLHLRRGQGRQGGQVNFTAILNRTVPFLPSPVTLAHKYSGYKRASSLKTRYHGVSSKEGGEGVVRFIQEAWVRLPTPATG
jgi:hypothetical protein